LLAHAHTSFTNVSQSVQNQLQNISQGLLIDLYKKIKPFLVIDLGSVICSFTVKRYGLEIPILFVSWRGRYSFRPFVSHSSRKFYFSLCNVDHTTISKFKNSQIFFHCLFFLEEIIDKLTIEEKNDNKKKDDVVS
jgi:hypothetical protein